MNPAVRFNSAVCLLGRFPALAGLDFGVAPGEIVLVEGRNGAGKTTLLRACAGLVRVTEGQAEVLGFDLRRQWRQVRPLVSVLGHATHLYDDLTVEENLRFAARAAAGSAIERPEVVADLDATMGRLGLDQRVRQLPVGLLSAGQRRRVAVARLLVRPARLWLLDEPHAGLDAASRGVVDDLVGEAAQAGTTVVLASHELERARPLAHRVVTLVGGRILSSAREPVGVA